MEDGAIIQIGTPEDLVLRPATDYVAEFTRGISRSKVHSARAVMPPPVGDSFAGRVRAAARIETIAAEIIDADGPFAVIDDNDRVIGQLTADDVISVLVTREDRG